MHLTAAHDILKTNILLSQRFHDGRTAHKSRLAETPERGGGTLARYRTKRENLLRERRTAFLLGVLFGIVLGMLAFFLFQSWAERQDLAAGDWLSAAADLPAAGKGGGGFSANYETPSHSG